MSLRLKVALWLALIASLTTIAIGVVAYRTTRDRLLAEIDRSLVDVGGVLRQDLIGRARLPERGPLSGLDAQIVAADGTVIESTFPTALPVDADVFDASTSRPTDRIDTVTTDDGSYRVRTFEFRRGVIQVGRALDDVDRVLRELRNRIVVWSLLVGAVASAIGWVIAGRVTASLRRLTVAAEHVQSTGRFDVDVGAAGGDEVGRLTGAFDAMLAALARSKDEQRRLVQDAGHELRTPLTSLRTNIDTLQRFPELAADDRAAVLADLDAETHELTQLVDEIVAVASGEVSDEPFVVVDLVDLVREVAERYERRTGRSIAVEGAEAMAPVQVGAVQRAVSCLLDNARKFDSTDTPVEVSVSVVVDRPTITVRDRGPGVEAGDLPHVFERFYRADSARSQPGSGLGLSIVDAVARRHGGEAFARPRAGGGAEIGFSVELPTPIA